jgi:phosphate transport system permease protein
MNVAPLSTPGPISWVQEASEGKRHRLGRAFELACSASTWFGFVVLLVLLASIFAKAVTWPSESVSGRTREGSGAAQSTTSTTRASGPLSLRFLTSYDSRTPTKAGLKAGLWGSLWLALFVTLLTVPVGVGAAIYLEEYSNEGRLKQLIQLNLSNLAGVPSIVYGILGMTVFVRMFGLFGRESKVLELSLGFTALSIPIPLGHSVLAGALTLSLLVLPTVIVAAQEALRAVPGSIRTAAYALGATQWQTIWHQVLPSATPGIMTGVILALSRALGETAPLVMVGAATYIASCPGGIDRVSALWQKPDGLLHAPFDNFTALPMQIYNWVDQAKPEYEHVAAAGIIVLLVVLLCLNAVAILIRNRFQRKLSW